MKRVMSVSLPVAALVVALSAGDARAQSNPWSVSFDLGTQIALSGDVHGGGSGTVLNLPTQVQARSYGDIYGNGFYWAAGLGYRVGEAGEIRVQGSYTSNPADRLQVGTVASLPLFALFDDYKAFGMDFGYRQYFGTATARPYVGAGGGFVRARHDPERIQRPGGRSGAVECEHVRHLGGPELWRRRRGADQSLRQVRGPGWRRVQVAG